MIEDLETEKQAIANRIQTLRAQLLKEVENWTAIIDKIESQKQIDDLL